MRKEFTIYVIAGFGLAALIHFITQGSEYREDVLAVSSCVEDRWTEYEGRTESIPPVELERDWHKDCARLVRLK